MWSVVRAFVLVIVLVCAAACERCEPANFVPASDRRIVYGGRFEPRADGAMRFAWPGSRIELRYNGGTLRMRLGDVPVEDETRETDWFAIQVDDQPVQVLHAAEGSRLYTIAQALPAGSHRVQIVKRTEAEVGTAILHGFELDRGRTLEPPGARPARHFELIGDSITAGYGNEAPSADCHWNAAFENGDRTYGAVAARALGASYTAAAWSGKGLLRNFDPRDVETMAVLHDRIIPTERGSARALAVPETVAIVINLGTNDFFPGIPDERAFVAAYRALIAKLRTNHPKAVLVLALGPMLADDFPHPQSRSILRRWLTAIRDELHAHGDREVELLELWFDPAEGLGCDSHPNVKTHARMGLELAELVRKHLK